MICLVIMFSGIGGKDDIANEANARQERILGNIVMVVCRCGKNLIDGNIKKVFFTTDVIDGRTIARQ